MFTKQEFIGKIREKYPQYSSIGDEQLYTSILEKHPEYKSQIKIDTPVATKPVEKEKFSLYNSLFTAQNPTVAALKPLFSTENPAITPVIGVASGATKLGADYHKFKTGYFDEMAQGKTPSTGTNLGFVGKTAQSIIQKEADFSKRKAEQGGIGQTSIEKGLDQVSGGLSIFNSIIGQGVGSIASIPATEQQKADAKMVGQKIASSDVGQAVGRTIGDLAVGAKEFERQNPRIGSQLRNVGTLAETVGNLAGTGFAKKGATSVAEKVGANIKELPDLTGKTQAFKDFVSGKIIEAKNIGKVEGVGNIPVLKTTQTVKVGGSFADRLKSGLSKEQIAGYQANPAQKAEVGKLYKRLDSPEGIADIKDYKVERVGAVTKELTDEIDKIRTTKGETGEVYNSIKASDVKIEVPPLLSDITSTLKKSGMEIKGGNIVRMPGSAAKDLNSGDITKFDTLYKDILADAQKGYLTPKEILSFRSTASSLSKYDAGTTTTGQGIMKAVRRNIDKTAKEKVPGLKELDAKFQDKVEELEDAIQDLVYKGGDVKGEWRSNIVSIIGTLDKANRAKLLVRLEEVIPGIGEKIKAIDNIPGIAKAIQDKGKLDKFVGFGGALSGVTIGATLGPAGAVIGFLLGFAGGKMLDVGITGIRKKAILKILSKMSPEGMKKLARIKDKIKKKLLLTNVEKQELDNLKATFKKETTPKPKLLLPAGRKQAIVTPQTAEKAVIAESKKGLEKTKFGEKIDSADQIKTTLSNLNESNIDSIASKITSDAKILPKVKEVIQKYIKEYGENINNYLGLLADDLADILGSRQKLLGGEKAKLFNKSRWEQAKEMTKAGKSADEVGSKQIIKKDGGAAMSVGTNKYTKTINIQDKNDINYLKSILGEDRVNNIKNGILKDYRGTLYSDMAKVNIVSKTPQTVEQILKGKITPIKTKSNIFYHGTSGENADSILKTGFKGGNEIKGDIFRGGGYGKIQTGISFAETPKEAGIFSNLTKNGKIIETKIKDNAKIVSIKGVEDAIELEEYISYLKKQKIDAVYIGGGEKELVIINKDIIDTKQIYEQATKPKLLKTSEKVVTPSDDIKNKNLGVSLKKAQEYSDLGKSGGNKINVLRKEIEYRKENRFTGGDYKDIVKEYNELLRHYKNKDKNIIKAIEYGNKDKIILSFDGATPVIYFELPNGQVSFHIPGIIENEKYKEFAEKYGIKFIQEEVVNGKAVSGNYEWSGKNNSREIIEDFFLQTNKPKLLKKTKT